MRRRSSEFGAAFTLRSLYRAIQFCQAFADREIVSTLSTQLSWSHFIELLPIKDPLARDFYAEMRRIERWDVRTLRQRIGDMQAIRALAGRVRDLQQQAAQQYLPVVDDILRTGSRDTQRIEQTLDGLLDFCGHEPVLQLYKKLCRHYWAIDPAAAAAYVNAYREYWGSDEPGGQP